MDQPDQPSRPSHPGQPSQPTAAELGISDADYARIVRDLHARGDAVHVPEPVERTRVPSRRRPWVAMGVGALCSIWLVTHVPALDPRPDEPEYAFMHSVGGKPVAYSSCGIIQVAVYPAGGPTYAEDLVDEAVAIMRSATGLDIAVSGSFGGHAPNWNFESGPVHPDDPISISWQDGAAIAQLTDHVAGLGGSRIMPMPYGGERLVAGTIALSREYYAGLSEPEDHGEALAVLLHELGHVLGLDHVGSRSELMYESVTDLDHLGPGDLQGLRILGQGRC